MIVLGADTHRRSDSPRSVRTPRIRAQSTAPRCQRRFEVPGRGVDRASVRAERRSLRSYRPGPTDLTGIRHSRNRFMNNRIVVAVAAAAALAVPAVALAEPGKGNGREADGEGARQGQAAQEGDVRLQGQVQRSGHRRGDVGQQPRSQGRLHRPGDHVRLRGARRSWRRTRTPIRRSTSPTSRTATSCSCRRAWPGGPSTRRTPRPSPPASWSTDQLAGRGGGPES